MAAWKEKPVYTPVVKNDSAESLPDATVPVRAENEDDDGYDPYSDWHDQGPSEPTFERDPWD